MVMEVKIAKNCANKRIVRAHLGFLYERYISVGRAPERARKPPGAKNTTPKGLPNLTRPIWTGKTPPSLGGGITTHHSLLHRKDLQEH